MFKQAVVIFNPASTNPKRLTRRIRELEAYFTKAKITIIETSKKGEQENRQRLIQNKELLGPDTLLCIAAGDGTVNLIIETLLTASEFSEQMRLTPVLPLWGGNANDLAHMLNGYTKAGKVPRVLKNGNVIAIKPIEIVYGKGKSQKIEIAACYASFGATAFTANQLNQDGHRSSLLNRVKAFRFFAELITVLKAVITVPRFKVDDGSSTRNMYEYAFINGSRMAKVERMPIKLTDESYYVVKVFRKHPVILLYILQLLRRQPVGRVSSQSNEFELLTKTWLQTDGEVTELSAHTTVQVRIGSKPFYALSRRLK